MEYTEDQIRDMLQREADRRVTEALKTAKEKFDAEKEAALQAERERVKKETLEQATLSAEELAKKQLEEKIKEISSKEAEIAKKQNLLLAKEKLTEAGVPKTGYENLLGIMVTENEDATIGNVDQFIKVFTSTKTELETAIRSELSKVPPPSGGGSGADITKEKFATMSYKDKMELKQTNPELFSTFIKG